MNIDKELDYIVMANIVMPGGFRYLFHATSASRFNIEIGSMIVNLCYVEQVGYGT